MKTSILLASLLPPLFAGDLSIREVDLDALLNPGTRHLEVERLGKENWAEPTEEQRKHFVQRAAVIECPQAKERASFYLLAEDSFGKGWPFGEAEEDNFWLGRSYPPEQIAETFPERFLFGVVERWTLPDERGLQKSLGVRLEDQVIHFFDESGKELRPFGGGNMISDGYLLDVNRDGVLEIVDYGLCSSGDKYFRVLKVKTVERKPKVLLRVALTEESLRGDWLRCADQDGDGFYEVVIGRVDDEGIVFKWDDEGKTFEGPEGGPGKSFAKLGSGNVWGQLKKLADAGGLKNEAAAEEEEAEVKRREKPVPLVVRQAGEAGREWVWEMMSPGVSSYRAEYEAHAETRLPDDFAKMDPGEAALAFVDGSRSEEHRKEVKLGIWKGGNKKPGRGWMVYESASSGCYVMTTRLTAISFGVPNPRVVVIDYSSNGVVGRNPYLDTAGYDLRVITITVEESEWVSDFLWSLNRIRSLESGDVPDYSGMGSTADGSASFYLTGNRTELVNTFGTIWATGRLAERWETGYQPETCLNFMNWYLFNGLQKQLGVRWEESDLTHHSLSTSDEEKRKDRHSQKQRDELRARIRNLLELHESQPLPYELLASVTNCASDVGLFELKDHLRKLAASLPDEEAIEKRIVKIQNEPIDPRILDDPFDLDAEIEDDDDDDYEVSLRRVFYPISLRGGLTSFFKRSGLMDDPKALAALSREKSAQRFWALRQLRKKYPAEYAKVLGERFEDAESIEEKWLVMGSLVAEVPEVALTVVDRLDEKTRGLLSPVFAELLRKTSPETKEQLKEDLVKLAQDKTQPWERRCPAIDQLVPDENQFAFGQEDLDEVLLEIANEEKSKVDQYVPTAVSTSALSALSQRGKSEGGWQLVLGRLRAGKDEGVSSLIGVAARYASHEARWRNELEEYFNRRLDENQARLGEVFEVALAYDFRSLEDEARALATANPNASESESASTIQGEQRVSESDRFHGARQAAVFWGQESANDRFQALASRALQAPWDFRGSGGDSLSMAFLLSKVTREARADAVEAFLEWADDKREERSGDVVDLIKRAISE